MPLQQFCAVSRSREPFILTPSLPCVCNAFASVGQRSAHVGINSGRHHRNAYKRGTNTSRTIIAAGTVSGAVRKLLWQGLPMQTIVSWQPGWKSSIQARSAAEPWDPPPVMAAAKLLQSKEPEAARWRKVNQPPAAFSAPQWTRDRRSMPPQAYNYPDSFLFTSVAERHGLLWQGAGAEMRGLGSPAWCRPSCPISRRCRPARLEQLARQKKASGYSAGGTAEVLGLLGVHPDDLANLRHRAAFRGSPDACPQHQ